MSREVVAILYCHNSLISLVGLDCQRKPLMRTDVKRREIWEWSDHTLIGSANSIQINTSLLMTGRFFAAPVKKNPSKQFFLHRKW
jgi:hypothetical protein